MKKRIVIVTREKLETCPPLISGALILNELGYEITLIVGGVDKTLREKTIQKGIKLIVFNFYTKNDLFKIKKILSSLYYRIYVNRTLSKLAPDYLVVEGQGAFKTLGRSIKKYKYILYILELYLERLKMIGRIIDDAEAIIMPEYNRAVFYQTFFKLANRPYILPNKPYFELDEKTENMLEEKYSDLLKIFKEYKVILYQGIIHKERDLSNYIKSMKYLDSDFRMVLLGKDFGMVDEYKKIDDNIIHIDFIPAPDYLIFTKNAYIGILTYDPLELNCAYCAPNKLYEYSKYSLPMLGNNIPGLEYTIGKSESGVIIDDNLCESIKDGILKIKSNYKYYSFNSRKFYEQIDNKKIISDIILEIKKINLTI